MVELAKRRGFFWPSFSIYGGESGLYDYGPLGVLLRDNIVNLWKASYMLEDALFIDTPVMVPHTVFNASGHIARFYDIGAECSSCHTKQKLESILRYNKIEAPVSDIASANEALETHVVKCPVCGARITEAKEFYQMFRLPAQGSSGDLYLRPETAQGIFVNFKLLNNVNRGRIPMVTAQYGKGFRNEISPRQALIRLREFSQGEVEVFVHPEKKYWKDLQTATAKEITALTKDSREVHGKVADLYADGILGSNALSYFINKTNELLVSLGINPENIRFRQHHDDERAHYSRDSWDAEVLLGDEWVEIVGIADRDDLKTHETSSGESMHVKVDDEEIIPSIIEPSYGIDRMVLAVMMKSFYVRANGYKVLRLKPDVAPYHAAVLPLVNKDGLDTAAESFYAKLRTVDPYVAYDRSGSIGRRYARQDEIGTPLCITFDYDSLKDGTVTVRDRDTTKQIRMSSEEILKKSLKIDIQALIQAA